jgi:serine/threonine protein phosphatase PrpC
VCVCVCVCECLSPFRPRHLTSSHPSLVPPLFPSSHLPTTRGLGDLDFKERSLLTCEPEVVAVLLQPFVDVFSVFASDGVWGFVSDQDVVDAVHEVILEVCVRVCVCVCAGLLCV